MKFWFIAREVLKERCEIYELALNFYAAKLE